MKDKHSISFSTEEPILFDSNHEKVDVNILIEICMKDPKRILADDELGVVVYVGDLGIYRVSGLADPKTGQPPPDSNGHWGQPIIQISRVRFPERIVRHQIGSVVMSITADSVFLIRDEERIRKISAGDLEKGMVLHTGEKIYW